MRTQLFTAMAASALCAVLVSCHPTSGPLSTQETQRPSSGLAFDFGTAETAEGYVAVGANETFAPERGYGWVAPPDDLRDRGAPDPLLRDFIFSRKPARFRVAVEPGTYRLTVVQGDVDYGDHFLTVSIPSAGVEIPTLNSQAAEFATATVAFLVAGPTLDIQFTSPTNNWALNALKLEQVAEPEEVKITKKKEKVVRVHTDEWQDVFSWPDPIAPYVARLREDMEKFTTSFSPTGLTRADYLDLLSGNVDYFKTLQNNDGAIIDPHKNIEWQYSTPCFALAAATLVAHDGRTDLIEPAAAAMDWATWTLNQRKAATAHEDFYPPQIAHALPLLKPHVTAERYAKWESNIRTFDPYATYRSACGHGNWNVVCLSGEGLFYLMGLRETPQYTLDCLAGQGRLFNNPWGLYTEGPMPYDHFPRIWAADMLAAGFQGKNTDKLAEVLRRGALTSLFMQSPTGELPAGGRSAHHQWNEAEQCLTYEIYAAQALGNGDEFMAGVFKRAAHLALASMKRWQRPSGELWIVKNRLDPAQYLGYEGYSSHSQYNLLAMAMLAIAFEHAAATEGITERPAPADVGGFVIKIDEPFRKVIANADGMYVEIDYGADLSYNATGLLRVHKSKLNPQLGPSDALTEYAIYHVPEGSPMTTSAMGVSWVDQNGNWRRLGEFGGCGHKEKFDRRPAVEIRDIHESPGRVSFTLCYTGEFGGPSEVVERYNVFPDHAQQRVSLTGYNGPIRIVWPVLASDGERETSIRIEDGTVKVEMGRDTQNYLPNKATSVRVEEERYPFRNGWARLAVAEFPDGDKAALIIWPEQKNE